MATPLTTSGTITGTDKVEIDCLGLNTAAIVTQGEWTGRLVFEAKIGDSPWFAISITDAYALDGQAPIDIDHNTVVKAPITGYSKFRVSGELNTGSANVYIGASEGCEVVQEILAYTFVTMASDSHPLAVFTVDNPNP